ncbi:MAG: hypothetical protein AAB116_02065 [Candidatus Poribacteria bacterium]
MTTDKVVEIGRYWWCGGGTTMGFQGLIDEVKLWRSALTKAEVALAMDGKLTKIAVSPLQSMPIMWDKIKSKHI